MLSPVQIQEKFPVFSVVKARKALLAQLEKDTGYTVEASPEREDFMEQAFNGVRQIVQYLEEKNPRQLSVILYRIDVSEPKIEKSLRENEANFSFSEIVANAILLRESQKVFFRLTFGAQN